MTGSADRNTRNIIKRRTVLAGLGATFVAGATPLTFDARDCRLVDDVLANETGAVFA